MDKATHDHPTINLKSHGGPLARGQDRPTAALAPADQSEQPFRLDGRLAVVTGAASGIGRETARIFAPSGARVVAVDLNFEGLQQLRKRIEQDGHAIELRTLDISDKSAVEELARGVRDAFGAIDVWVNGAGISFIHEIVGTKVEEAMRTIAVNMLGPYWACMAAGEIMVAQRRGSIVNVSSEGGATAVPNLAIYCMTKAAVNSLTRTAAREFGPHGVRVNAVAPGWVDTPMASVLYTDGAGRVDEQRRTQVLEQMADRSSLGLVGQPSDIGFARSTWRPTQVAMSLDKYLP